MIRVIICGIAGRMGREVLACAQAAEDMKVVGGIELPGHISIGDTIQDIPVHDDLSNMLTEVDCVVEFTDRHATLEHLKSNVEAKKAYVTGTTGFSADDTAEIERLARSFPIFLAPNMSLGVNHLYTMVGITSKILADYDIEVVETHHGKKKDAPSGTARAIVSRVKQQRPDIKVIHGREGMTGERRNNEMCVHAVRGGDIVGEHRVVFFGDGEFLEIRHYATSRRCFAAGTLAAVRYAVGQQSGLFTMQDMLEKQE